MRLVCPIVWNVGEYSKLRGAGHRRLCPPGVERDQLLSRSGRTAVTSRRKTYSNEGDRDTIVGGTDIAADCAICSRFVGSQAGAPAAESRQCEEAVFFEILPRYSKLFQLSTNRRKYASAIRNCSCDEIGAENSALEDWRRKIARFSTASRRVGWVQPTARNRMQDGGLHPPDGRRAGPLDSNDIERCYMRLKEAENPQFLDRDCGAELPFEVPLQSLENRVIDQPRRDETVAGCTGGPRRCMVGFADIFSGSTERPPFSKTGSLGRNAWRDSCPCHDVNYW